MLYNIKPISLHRVFHSIRFKVIKKDWPSEVSLFCFYVALFSCNACSLTKYCYLCIAFKGIRFRAFSSAGSEHLPYKQRVGGSNPSTPTKRKAETFVSAFLFSHTQAQKKRTSLPASYIIALCRLERRWLKLQACLLVESEDQVHVLHSLASRALQQVVYRTEH